MLMCNSEIKNKIYISGFLWELIHVLYLEVVGEGLSIEVPELDIFKYDLTFSIDILLFLSIIRKALI